MNIYLSTVKTTPLPPQTQRSNRPTHNSGQAAPQSAAARKPVQQNSFRSGQDSGESRPRSSGPVLNKVMLIGTLTRDPEVRTTPKGSSLANLSLAMNRTYTTDQGERREETTFVDVETWGRQAEIAGEYLRKGRPVYIEGRLKLDSWDDKETGQKRSKLKVVAEVIQFLGSRDSEGSGSGSGHPVPPPHRNGSRNTVEETEDEEFPI